MMTDRRLGARLLARLRSRRGLALVTVLWVLTLLALIAASFTKTTRTEINLARNQMENAKAEALADAGVYRAILGLMDPIEATRWKADGRVYRFRLGGEGEDEDEDEDEDEGDGGGGGGGGGDKAQARGGGEVEISIRDEIGKIDLNRAQDELLQALFELSDLTPEDAAALVDAIVDFRDPDDLRRLNGAEDRDYAAAGMPWGTKDAPFEAVEELQQVLGMDMVLYNRVAPALTVYAHRPGFNPNFAPREVLLALPGVDKERIGGFVSRREELKKTRAEEAARKAGEEPLDETIFETVEERAAKEEGNGEEVEEEDSLFPDEDVELLNALAEHPEITRYYTLGPSRGRYTIRAEGRTVSGALFIRDAAVQLPRGGTAQLPRAVGGAAFSILHWRQGRRAQDDEELEVGGPEG